jgi:hypothetical protein
MRRLSVTFYSPAPGGLLFERGWYIEEAGRGRNRFVAGPFPSERLALLALEARAS